MRACAVAILLLSIESKAHANGGPFLVREPGGDPATKGAPAPILPDLLPGRESRLQVVKEELGFRFTDHPYSPRVEVQAQYSIRNPTDDSIELEIGFPIVRGIFRPYYGGGMGGGGSFGLPMVTVRVEKKSQPFEIASKSDLMAPDRLNRYAITHPYKIVSNSDLLTRIRRHAYGIIDGALKAHTGLQALRDQIKAAAGNNKSAEDARKKLAAVLIKEKGWSERDAGLLANFARVVWQPAPPPPPSSSKTKSEEEIPDWLQRNYPEQAGGRGRRHKDPPQEVPFFEPEPGTMGLGFFSGNESRWPPYLGPLASLGELKATQLFSHLASRFAPAAEHSYESIFTAWGGDVRERAVDLDTGALRPRQNARSAWAEEPIYARVEVFNPDVVVDLEKRAACKAIAANLPVTFTFAPMNLIRTTVTFPKRSTSFLIFTYVQNPFEDTATPASYQLAYLVHPASFWEQFGPIEVAVQVPKGVPVSASVPIKRTEVRSGIAIYKGVLKDKTGELLVAVPKDAWHRMPDGNK